MVILAPGSKYLTAWEKGFASERAHSLPAQCFIWQRPRAAKAEPWRGRFFRGKPTQAGVPWLRKLVHVWELKAFCMNSPDFGHR
jgi:hypothetical protein